MGRKSRRNRSNRKESRAPPTKLQAGRLLEQKFQRKDQATIMRDLLAKYHGRVPVYALIGHRAIRLEGVISR